MQRELKISVDERVYEGLKSIGGPDAIGQFIESLILPRFAHLELDSDYERLSEDKIREAEALEWAEAAIGDASK